MFFQNQNNGNGNNCGCGCSCNNQVHTRRSQTTMPQINCDSYTYTLQPQCEIAALTLDLVSNTNCAMVCDFVSYTLTITNNCSSTLNKPILNINLGDSLCYRLDSLTVDGTVKENVRCLRNLLLDDIAPNTTVVITFIARVMNNVRYNIINADLTYSLSCCCQTRCYKTVSNDALVQVCQCCTTNSTSI